MTYIDLINRFWKVHEANSFSAVEIGLYFKLLDIANKMHWEKEKLFIPMNRLQMELAACKSSVLKARKRLEEADLIAVQSGHGNRQAAGYEINGVKEIVQKEGAQMNKGVNKPVNKPVNKKEVVSDRPEQDKTTNESDCDTYHGRTDNHTDDHTDNLTHDPYIRLDQDKDQEIDTDQKMMINDHSGEDFSQERDEVVLDAEEIVQLFNGICHSLKKVHKLSPTTREKLNQRMKDFKTKAQWEAYFHKVAQSPFLCGPNQYSWQPDLFWLIKDEDTPKRIMAGKYDARKPSKTTQEEISMSPFESYDPVRGACYTNADFGNDNDLVDELAGVVS